MAVSLEKRPNTRLWRSASDELWQLECNSVVMKKSYLQLDTKL